MQATLHQTLKDSTRARHEEAEQHPFQGYLAHGKLPVASYTTYLLQLHHLHRAFESRLRVAARGDSMRDIVKDEYFQLPFLATDLAALGVSPNAEPALPCIGAFDAQPVFQKQPLSLLGVLYVVLGSKHGGRFIAHKVKESYELQDAGYTYFNPYGESFRPLWQGFTQALNDLPDDDATRASVLSAADATFGVVVDIGDAIWRTQQAAIQR